MVQLIALGRLPIGFRDVTLSFLSTDWLRRNDSLCKEAVVREVEIRLQKMTAQSRPDGPRFPPEAVRKRLTVLYILVRSCCIENDTVTPTQRVLYVLFYLARMTYGFGRFMSMPWT